MLVVVPEKFKVTDEQFEQLCQANDEVGFETNSEGELIVVSPTGETPPKTMSNYQLILSSGIETIG